MGEPVSELDACLVRLVDPARVASVRAAMPADEVVADAASSPTSSSAGIVARSGLAPRSGLCSDVPAPR